MSWLKRKIFGKTISVSVIGAGNAGCKIGDLIIAHFKENDINVKSLAINYTDDFEPEIKNYGEKFWFGEKKKTSNYRIEEAQKDIQHKEEDLYKKVEKVVYYKKEDIKEGESPLALHLVIGSGGGTGAAGSMLASKMIERITGNAPTVVFIVPEKNEPSMIQYNASKALYYLGFGSDGPQSPIILFDNNKLIQKNEKDPVEKAIKKSNESLAETLVTTILAAMQESNHEEYNAGLDDFFRAISHQTKGIGVIVSLDKTFEEKQRSRNVRFSDMFFESLEENSSLTAEITRAKRGFLAITAPDSYQVTFETKKIAKRFEKGSISVALTSIDEPLLSIRGVLMGINPDFVERFWELLKTGRDTRKEILKQEKEIKNAKIEIYER